MTRKSFTKELRRFSPIISHITLLSVFIGVAALAPTLYNMALYDQIIVAGSAKGLWPLFFGVVLALSVEILFRTIRSKQLSYFGARLDHFISSKVIDRLMRLPSVLTERASVSAQIARLRDFESVRDFFTGSLASLFFEMPLMVVYLAVMTMIAPVLVLVPLTLLAAYALLIGIGAGRFRERSAEAAVSASQRQEFILETMSKLRHIRLAGMEESWQKRYAEIWDNSAKASFQTALQAQNFETISYAFMTLGALGTLTLGVTQVIAQNITTGALVACMILIWRIISPMQVCCASMARLQQLASTSTQIKRVMEMSPEDKAGSDASKPDLKGAIEFYRVSMRYSAEAEPALLGVSFKIRPGQIVAIRGVNGSGKSTLLKMILGLYTPQSGCVRVDGVDIRQYNPSLLRQAMTYVPQSVDFFPGTIRDNLLLINPAATDEACWDALERACARDEVKGLVQGLDTVVAGENAENISFLLKQRLNLARAYVNTAPIMLFDEASHSLGKDNDRMFEKFVAQMRGKTTIIIVTHREDHARMADQVLVMEKGELIHIGVQGSQPAQQKGGRS